MQSSGESVTVVSVAVQTTAIQHRDILSSWESLLHWSENASVARQLQEDMAGLKGVLGKLGRSTTATCDSETSIQLCIEELRNEKTALQTHRSAMLRLNASVHSWLTRQELKLAKAREQQRLAASKTAVANTENGTTEAATSGAQRTSTASDSATQMDELSNDEEELHKQLKNEVGDMYSEWDEADARIGARLDGLTASLIAWKQFESGLNEFKEALGKDKGALRGLNGILDGLGGGNEAQQQHRSLTTTITTTTAAPTAVDIIASAAATSATTAGSTPSERTAAENTKLALDVKEVAKRLSEHLDINHQRKNAQQPMSAAMPVQQIAGQETQYLNSLLTAIPFGLSSSSNGSLSDSGISDGGASSDYGLSERERRLSALRRLARQLENALAPGSAALDSISQRMAAAETDLRSLQDTCRQLIVRTAASQMQQQQQQQQQKEDEIEATTDVLLTTSDVVDGALKEEPIAVEETTSRQQVAKKNTKPKRSPQSSGSTSKRQNNRQSSPRGQAGRTNGSATTITSTMALQQQQQRLQEQQQHQQPGDPSDDPDGEGSDGVAKSHRRRWARRVAKYALPIQMALVAIICAVACLEPHCCDNLNNNFMSFTPQLRYVRGPPPI